MILNRILCSCILFLSFIGYSQEVVKDTAKVRQLDEVVITATRTLRQLSSVPLAVTLISNKEIKKAGSTRLRNILQEQTGIVFVTDPSGFEGIQMQGLNAAYTLVLIDGVPLVGRSAGTLDLRRLTVNDVKQIEIVKGPSSSLYGSEAIGGVINIITHKLNRDTNKGDLQFYFKGGNRSELDLNTNYAFKKGKFGIKTGLNLNAVGAYDLSPSTSYKTSNPYENYTGTLDLTYEVSKQLNIVQSNRFYQQNQKLETHTNTVNEYNFHTKVDHKLSEKVDVDYSFYATNYKTKSIFNGNASHYNQSLIRPEVRAVIKFNKNELITGVGASFDALDRTFFAKKESFKTHYVFGQFDYKLTEDLNIILGARFDHHNKYKSAFSPKISARYKLNDWLAIKSSVGYGFKAPDFRQLFFNFNNSAGGYIVYGVRTMHELFGQIPAVQNQVAKDLNPENSIGYNLSFQMKPIQNLKLNVNFFRNDIKDLINTAVFNGVLPGINPTTRVFYYENRNKVYTQGVELDAHYRFTDNISVSGGYQFLIAKDKDQEKLIKSGVVYFRKTSSSPSQQLSINDYVGLANRSKHTANLKLSYRNFQHNFFANLRAIYRSKYALYDTNSSQQIIDRYDDFVKPHVLLNASITKPIYSVSEIQIGVDNLLNSDGMQNEKLFPKNDAVLRVGRTIYARLRVNF